MELNLNEIPSEWRPEFIDCLRSYLELAVADKLGVLPSYPEGKAADDLHRWLAGADLALQSLSTGTLTISPDLSPGDCRRLSHKMNEYLLYVEFDDPEGFRKYTEFSNQLEARGL